MYNLILSLPIFKNGIEEFVEIPIKDWLDITLENINSIKNNDSLKIFYIEHYYYYLIAILKMDYIYQKCHEEDKLEDIKIIILINMCKIHEFYKIYQLNIFTKYYTDFRFILTNYFGNDYNKKFYEIDNFDNYVNNIINEEKEIEEEIEEENHQEIDNRPTKRQKN